MLQSGSGEAEERKPGEERPPDCAMAHRQRGRAEGRGGGAVCERQPHGGVGGAGGAGSGGAAGAGGREDAAAGAGGAAGPAGSQGGGTGRGDP